MPGILWDTPGTHVRDSHTAKSDPTINPICGEAASRPKQAAAIRRNKYMRKQSSQSDRPTGRNRPARARGTSPDHPRPSVPQPARQLESHESSRPWPSESSRPWPSESSRPWPSESGEVTMMVVQDLSQLVVQDLKNYDRPWSQESWPSLASGQRPQVKDLRSKANEMN